MSEGTPGRGPDADTRTDEGQGARPAPVRYGPRNGVPRNGTNGTNGAATNGRTVTGPTSPQQYRAPQSPRGPQTGPASYTHPRPSGAPVRPTPDVEDRRVSDARTASAARNASVAKGHDPAAASEATKETAVIPAVATEIAPAEKVDPASASESTSETTADTTPESPSGPGFFGRLREARERLVAKGLEDPESAAAIVEAAPGPAAPVQAEERTEPTTAEIRAEDAEDAEEAEDRPLTLRERLGLPPKTRKPQPVDVPESGPGVPTAAAAAALAAGVAAGTANPETKAAPVGPTHAPQLTEPIGRVTPASPVPAVITDTVVIPAVDAGAISPTSPAAAATGQVLVAARPKVGAARRTRKARLRLSRVDPWSVMKTALLFSIAAGIILVVATYGVWSVLNASGLFDAVNDMVKSVVSTPGDTTPFRIEEYVNTQKIIGVAALIAVVDVLIFTALATLGSFLYNLAATVLGGLEVTLAED